MTVKELIDKMTDIDEDFEVTPHNIRSNFHITGKISINVNCKQVYLEIE